MDADPDITADTVLHARSLAERLVSPLGRRWRHVQGVAARAQQLVPAIDPGSRHALVAAAWLHDIGYAPSIGHTRFHPLDGARWLRIEGWSERLVCLVAHHSGSRFEAAERGLSADLAEFREPDDPVMDALITADLTTSPDGDQVDYDARIAEILGRYPADDPVHRTWIAAAPVVREAINRTLARMARRN